jgi:hypothetical protein
VAVASTVVAVAQVKIGLLVVVGWVQTIAVADYSSQVGKLESPVVGSDSERIQTDQDTMPNNRTERRAVARPISNDDKIQNLLDATDQHGPTHVDYLLNRSEPNSYNQRVTEAQWTE